jgi:hypothetical protein
MRRVTPGNSTTIVRAEPPAGCPAGLMPREAFRGDTVCVTRAVHDQTVADNAAAPSRTNPNGSCIAGYVWREASADDHVCVLPVTRTQVWTTNRQQCGGDLHCKSGVVGSNKVVVAKPVVEPPRRIIFRPRGPRRGTLTRPQIHHPSRPQPPHGPRTEQRRSGSSRSKR